ncbi:MAG: HigA family addiction module antitoxin [Acidimicrobiia bacterium]
MRLGTSRSPRPLGVTQHRLAVEIQVPPRRINEIVHGKGRITSDTALRLAKYFGTSDRFWLNLQTRYDLEVHAEALAETLAEIVPLAATSRTS